MAKAPIVIMKQYASTSIHGAKFDDLIGGTGILGVTQTKRMGVMGIFKAKSPDVHG